MSLSSTIDKLHFQARKNRWLGYFAVFNRLALAAGFLPSGFVKIMGERFTSLSINHPMGQYLEALHHTGYYYTSIGVFQITAAILLLIPRTALLGALIYFPIILNICLLTFAVRFDGSLLTSPLMVLATMYLLCWDYHKLKYILPFNHPVGPYSLPREEELTYKFPILFFSGVAATVILVGILVLNLYSIKPYNTLSECQQQCVGNNKPDACFTFCQNIHTYGKTLDECLKEYQEEGPNHK